MPRLAHCLGEKAEPEMLAELSPGQLTARHTRDEPTRSAFLP